MSTKSRSVLLLVALAVICTGAVPGSLRVAQEISRHPERWKFGHREINCRGGPPWPPFVLPRIFPIG